MTFPKMYDTTAAAELLDLSPETLKNFRAANTGPNYVRLGGSIKYLEGDLLEWLNAQRVLPPIDGSKASTPAQLQAALTADNAAIAAARAERLKDMQQMDANDRTLNRSDASSVTMGFAGSQPGIERHFNVPPQSFSNEPPPHILKGR